MPTFRYFAENGKLLKVSNESMDETILNAYVVQYNKDRTAGYLESMADFVNEYFQICDQSDKIVARLMHEKMTKMKEFLSLPQVKELFDMDSQGKPQP